VNEVRRRVVQVALPVAVLAVAAATRLIGLEQPGELVFDETYYVKDAESLRQLGYEGTWPKGTDGADGANGTSGNNGTDGADRAVGTNGANELWAAGTPGSPSELASFVVHGPLGKWIIALGLGVLGPDSAASWRVGTAVAGVALVGLVMLLTHLLLGRIVLTSIAGLLIAIDGNAIVMSRIALLDGILAVFIVLAVIFVVLDRQRAGAQLSAWLNRRRAAGRPTDWGPVLWRRPWLLAAGATFGLAVGVKWSALYFLAAFALLTVAADALDRRRGGVALWASGTLLRQAPVSVALVIPAAIATHLLTWWGWFASNSSYGRERVLTDENRLPGILGSLPAALQNWWAYQTAVYGYHVGLSSDHNYEAPALGWPLLLRPTYMFYRDLGDGTAMAITGVPNPLIWWASVAAVLTIVAGCCLAAARALRVRRRALAGAAAQEAAPTSDSASGRAPLPFVGSPWAVAVVLTGVGAGWLPWLFYPERTMFFFYTIVITPFLVVALTMVMGFVLGGPQASQRRSASGVAIVIGMLALAIVISAFFLPLWTGIPIPLDQLRLRYWLPTWV
jgi:dolichyl-phosphate-mannose--protein O-mannosyl transferase